MVEPEYSTPFIPKSTRQHTPNRSVQLSYSQPYLPKIQHTGKADTLFLHQLKGVLQPTDEKIAY